MECSCKFDGIVFIDLAAFIIEFDVKTVQSVPTVVCVCLKVTL